MTQEKIYSILILTLLFAMSTCFFVLTLAFWKVIFE